LISISLLIFRPSTSFSSYSSASTLPPVNSANYFRVTLPILTSFLPKSRAKSGMVLKLYYLLFLAYSLLTDSESLRQP
jgi:hypothetical protein